MLPGNEAAEGIHRGVPYRVIGRGLRFGPSLFRQWRTYARAGRTHLESVRREGQVNVLYHYGQPDPENLVFLRAARRLGYVIVSSIVEDFSLAQEDVSVRLGLKLKMIAALDSWIARYTDAIGVLSSRLEEKYRDRGLPLALIPVSTELRPVRPRAEEHASPVRLLYAGTFGRKDGVEHLLDAFHLLREERPGVELLLVGDCAAAAAARLQPNGLDAPGVRRLGFLPDDMFDRVVDEADILCMTRVDSAYANAGFPFKLARYLASGNPVVATDVSDVSRYLADGRDARIAPPGDVRRLVDALRWLVDHPAEARALGARGRETCARHFDIERTGEQWMGLILRACARRGIPMKGGIS
jgi:glycosyltransferase involved in cell wall biosynthesis